MKTLIIGLALSLIGGAMPALAQDAEKTRLAHQLLDALQFDLILTQTPSPRAHESTPSAEDVALAARMTAFRKKYVTLALLRDAAAQQYAAAMTEAELMEAIAFASSSTGKKLFSAQRGASAAAQIAMMAAIQPHMAEYQRFVILGEGADPPQ
jgi:hypothetical protein